MAKKKAAPKKKAPKLGGQAGKAQRAINARRKRLRNV